MIIEAGFTDEMLDLLKGMKGKTFKSYECVDLGNFNTFSSGFRINLGRSSIREVVLAAVVHAHDYFIHDIL